MQTFISLRGLARRSGVPLSTAAKRARQLQLIPDGIISEPSRNIWLYRTEREAELRRALTSNQKIVTR